MTPETREVILRYMREKYPKGGEWNLSLRRPIVEERDEQAQPVEPAT